MVSELIKENKEVYYFKDQNILTLTKRDLSFLKSKVKRTKKKRIRFCFHNNKKDSLHEMVILLQKGTYIRPHMHIQKPESLHIIEGECDVIFFNTNGQIVDIKNISKKKNSVFYYRLNKPIYHTFVLKSKYVIFHETTTGPLNRSKTKYASWAPDEEKKLAVKKFLNELSMSIKSHKVGTK